jgi:hypothetical protein
MPGRHGTDDWQATWATAGTTLTVEGDHFTMLEAYAGDTGRTVHDWLAERGGSQ